MKSPGGLDRIRAWTAAHTLVAVSLVGITLYTAARLSYASFYGAFGVESEEVGLNYTVTLARAAPGLVALFVACTLGAVLFVGMGSLILLVSRVLSRSTRQSEPFGEALGVTGFAMLVLAAAWLFFSVLLFVLPGNSHGKAYTVSLGEEIEPVSGIFDLELFTNPLALRAEHVRIRWISSTSPADRPVPDGTAVAYLGRSSDTVVLYDFRERKEQTLRVPASLVMLIDVDAVEP